MKKSARRRRRSTDGKAPYFCCRTCRARRIKCDGGRPSCNNCIAHRRVCGGYSSWGISLDVYPSPTSSQSVTPSGTPAVSGWNSIPATPSTPLSNDHAITDEVRHAFDYFRYRICARYIERGYPILWAISSISVGLQEPAIFYAMAALSTAEQSLVPTIHTTLDRPVDEHKRDLALKMYSQAITCLREPMRNAIREGGSLEPIILSCLLFLVFEVTRGNNLNAIRHARIGKNILDERLSRDDSSDSAFSTPSSLGQPSQNIEMVRTERGSKYTPLRTDTQTRSLDPAMSFVSLEEARSYLEVLVEAGHEIREQLTLRAQEITKATSASVSTARQFCLSHTLSRTMAITGPIQTRLNDIINGFASWGRKFGLMFRSGEFISQDLFFMQLRFFYASFTLAMCRARRERLADEFADQFVRTLDSAERLLRQRPFLSQYRAEETSTGPVAIDFMQKLSIADRRCSLDMAEEAEVQSRIGPPTTAETAEDRVAGVFEFGILPALFTIACRCRTSGLRRRAARMLSDARRTEAINSSRTLSTYAERIIHLEEQQAARATRQHAEPMEFYADEVSESARFLDIVINPMFEDPGHFALICTKHIDEEGEDIEILEYECGEQIGDSRLVRVDPIMADRIFKEESEMT